MNRGQQPAIAHSRGIARFVSRSLARPRVWLRRLGLRIVLELLPRASTRGTLAAAGVLARSPASWEALQVLGRDLGLTAVVVKGPLGEVQGSISDEVLLPAYAKHGVWAPAMVSELRAAFGGDGGTFLDVGANIGLVTLAIASDSSIDCFAFEPEPRTYEYLRHNVDVNHCVNVRCFRSALWDSPGRLEFELASGNLGDHRVRGHGSDEKYGESSRPCITVDASPLDGLVNVATLRRPIVAKIDTQGAETHVIAGGSRTLGAADVVAMEYWPYGLARLGGALSTITAFVELFREARVARGESDQSSEWRPVKEVVSILSVLWNPAGGDYYDLLLRK